MQNQTPVFFCLYTPSLQISFHYPLMPVKVLSLPTTWGGPDWATQAALLREDRHGLPWTALHAHLTQVQTLWLQHHGAHPALPAYVTAAMQVLNARLHALSLANSTPFLSLGGVCSV